MWIYWIFSSKPVQVPVIVYRINALFSRFLCPRPLGGGIKRWCCLMSVCLMTSDVCRIHGPKSRTERPRKTKIGTEVAHVTSDSDTTFKVKRSRSRSQGAWAYCGGLRTACYIISRHLTQKQFIQFVTWFSGSIQSQALWSTIKSTIVLRQ